VGRKLLQDCTARKRSEIEVKGLLYGSTDGLRKILPLFPPGPARKMRHPPYFGSACFARGSFMASFALIASAKAAENVPGEFFVMDNCIDCDLCRRTAPQIFKRHNVGNSGYSFVWNQPKNDRQKELGREAMQACPVDAIGQNW